MKSRNLVLAATNVIRNNVSSTKHRQEAYMVETESWTNISDVPTVTDLQVLACAFLIPIGFEANTAAHCAQSPDQCLIPTLDASSTTLGLISIDDGSLRL